MKAVVLHDTKDLRYGEYSCPEIKPDDVLIRTRACGICGSDLPRYLSSGSYDMPKILGHEFMGEVVKNGYEVKHIQLGTRVAVNPLIPCRQCDFCRKNMFFHCTCYGFLGSRLDGGMAEYVAVPARNLIPLTDLVSDYAGAMLEPITVAYHCVKRMDVQPGQNVVVFGAGTIGLLVGQWVRTKQAHVTIVDIRKPSIEIARKCGLEDGIDASETDVKQAIVSRTNGFGADVTIEAAGARESTLESFQVTANRGKVGLVGRINGSFELSQNSMEAIQRKEIAVQGLWGFDCSDDDNDWLVAAEGLSQSQIVVEPMVTHVYPLSKTCDAIEMMAGGREYYCKVLVGFDE